VGVGENVTVGVAEGVTVGRGRVWVIGSAVCVWTGDSVGVLRSVTGGVCKDAVIQVGIGVRLGTGEFKDSGVRLGGGVKEAGGK
jgi:hypothetical protein